ncbi:MAG: hypothetical protein LBP80_11555, partial [Treponema sp.]|nr:hypothetical protein [Treponema sp.]
MLKTRRLVRVIFILFALPLLAREITVTVEDADLGIPLEGAVIRVSGGGSQSAEYTCDEAGTARVTIPDDGPGIIRVAYPGYENRRLTTAGAESALTVKLRLGGVMENAELVLEERRPGASETRSGRSVAISGEELSRTAEIGMIEDVMTSIKLLPGVGYSGMFNALPSIRGGDPGDLMAALDGFYLSLPYHWGGGVSIFDPRMVSSAQLSHGVFSTRYGHTISGLLEVTSRRPDPVEAEFELGLSTSAANVNLSYPINGKGGIMFMGKVTYWDTLVWAAKALAGVWTDNETLQMIHSVSTAPYIRSAALSANYRFSNDLELTLNGFFGSDGVGAAYRNSYNEDDIQGSVDMDFDYHNYQGFGITSLIINPIPSVVIKAVAGAGFTEIIAAGSINNDVELRYNQGFLDAYGDIFPELDSAMSYHAPGGRARLESDNHITSVQGRVDLDWELGKGFLAAFGVQELYNRWKQLEAVDLFIEQRVSGLPPFAVSGLEVAQAENGAIIRPFVYRVDVANQGFTSSAYALLEWKSPNQVIGAEAGFRVDHLYFIGRDGAGGDPFSVQTMPALNPRLNLDFGILKNAGIVDSLTITAGTGLFSSVNDTIAFMEERNGIGDFDLKPNRSWTSIIGTKIDFLEQFSFNIEGYYKYVFDRAYISADISSGNSGDTGVSFSFDGKGKIFGFDLQLQKLQSRFWDGWISYTFTHALYHEPSNAGTGLSGTNVNERRRDDWYYPSFHRFHNFNLVLNIKPVKAVGIAMRFGFASGRLKNKVSDTIVPYPVEVAEWDGTKFVEKRWDDEKQDFVPVEAGENPTIIQKYRRDSYYDSEERTTWSLPLDLKVSFFMFDRKGRVRTEIYLGAENILSLFYNA